jgi:4-hydroxybenzoate polyprenyltransferase
MRGQGSSDPPLSTAAVVADRQYGWIERLPARWRDYAVLARWDRPIGTWLLLLPCWWGQALADRLPDLWLMLLFAIGAIAMRGAGCTVNDLVDREFDRRVARTRNRPLASGRLGTREAILFIGVQCFVGLLVLLALNDTAKLVSFASVPLIVAYPFMKRITYWPQAFLGITFNWGALVGYVAVTGTLDVAALLLYAAGFFWTLGYDTIYAHQDKEDDALIGVRSTALLLGDATPGWLVGFYVTTLALLAAAGMAAGKGLLFFLALLPVAWLLLRQTRGLSLDDPVDCLARFRANRDAGLAVVVALALGLIAI